MGSWGGELFGAPALTKKKTGIKENVEGPDDSRKYSAWVVIWARDCCKVVIPGAAFPESGVYAVGVAGMHVGETEDYEEVNTALSSFLAGEMSFYGVVVY